MKNLLFFRENKMFTAILFFALIFLLRALVIPLAGDEITYLNISNNILEGKFYHNDYPSTVTPVIPFILSFFQVLSYPELGFALNKIFNSALFLIGLYFLYLFLKENGVQHKVAISIVAVTSVTNVVVDFASTLYPDALLFCCFWALLYYSIKEVSICNFRKIIFLFTLLTFTRYLYAVLGIIILISLHRIYKYKKEDFKKAIYYCFALLIPFVVWFKYVYNIESNNLSSLTYFSRFKEESSILYNVKAGLGLIQHGEVNRVNGVPAFISIFVPITGLSDILSWKRLSAALINGYISKRRACYGIKRLSRASSMVMLGLIFAGTGSSI